MKLSILILFSATLLLSGCHSTDESTVEKPISVQVKPVQEKDLVETLELTGMVNPEPNQSAKVAVVNPGLLIEVFPKIGDWVHLGQTVARLQESVQVAQVNQAIAAYQAASANSLKTQRGSRPQEISQARATLSAAQANLDNSRKNLARMQTLVAENIAAGKDVDAAVNQEQSALSQVQSAKDALSLALKGPRKEDRVVAAAQASQARASLAQAQADLNFTRITSPISGRVVERYLNVGDQAGPGSPILMVVNPQKVLIQSLMPVGNNTPVENKTKVSMGNDVQIIVPDTVQSVLGKVVTIGDKLDPVTNMIPIQIEATNPQGLLKIGMVVKTRVILGWHRHVLAIPKQSIISLSEYPNQPVVNRVDNHKSIPTSIQLGITDGDWVEVRQGLKAGQPVIIDVGYELPENTAVKLP